MSSDRFKQLDATEALYGLNVKFSFTMDDVDDLMKKESLYPDDVKNRVKEIISMQMHKYQYLF